MIAEKIANKEEKLAVIGLGYVGLPIALAFAKKVKVVGFDINEKRINELMSGVDSTLEVDNKTLKGVLVSKSSDSNGLFCTNKIDEINGLYNDIYKSSGIKPSIYNFD